MLYYFPDESPKDLRKKESESLEKEIKRAQLVKTRGYRQKDPTLPSFYAEWQCIHNYLKCPIKKWTYPVSSKDKVELEPIPSDFLPPMWTLRKLKIFDPESQEYVRRIVGFREIQKKREYIEYLRKVEEEIDNDDDSGGHGSAEEQEQVSGTFNKMRPFVRIGRGGGKKDKKDEKKNTRSRKKNKKEKEDIEAEGSHHSGMFTKLWHLFTGDEDKTKEKKGKKSGKKDAKNKGPAKKVMVEKEEEDDVKVRKWGRKDMGKQAELLEKEHQHHLAEIFKYHGLFRVRAGKERDSEWLELSNTDAEETEHEIKSFEKPKTDWMDEEISFESQYLTKRLKWFRLFSTYTGRSFFRIRPDDTKGHMDFTHKKRDMIFFFLTSIFFWICFCLITISFMEIQIENQQDYVVGGDTGTAPEGAAASTTTSNKTVEFLQNQAATARHNVEELQLNLYEVPLYVLLINIVLVSVWSIFVILGDGIFITHYFNCWCAALAEMETSGCLGIQKKIIMYHAEFVIYTGTLFTLFYFDYPKHVRESNLLIAGLVLRPLKPYMRIDSEQNLRWFQIGGMLLQIYVIYCSILIKLLMSILATILKNTSEMWNFKFALTFQQLATKNRGHLIRLSLNHSLLKLFTHHRILTVLLRNYGEVFSTPVMMSMICEMGVFTITMVRWFFYKPAEIIKAYHGSESVIVRTELSNPHRMDEIKIAYYHSSVEVYLVFYLSMIQLLFQFINTLDCLAKAGDSFFAGYEFVRRNGTMLCSNSHQRRLIQSLEWSFSSTNPSVLSANSFYAIDRATILSSFAAVAGFFSLIIQLQVQQDYPTITFNEMADCQLFDMELDRGTCIIKPKETKDFSIIFAG